MLGKLIAALLVIFVAPAWATHRVDCTVDVKVIDVKQLARLDGVATFGDLSDHEEVAIIEITKIAQQGPTGCLQVGTKTRLHIKKEQVGKYKAGDLLTLAYQNMGDSRASRVSWDIVKK